MISLLFIYLGVVKLYIKYIADTVKKIICMYDKLQFVKKNLRTQI